MKDLAHKPLLKAKNIIDENMKKYMCEHFNLIEVPAPVFVQRNWGYGGTIYGYDDGLTLNFNRKDYVTLHTTARWGRVLLQEYGFKEGEGIYCSLNCIDKDITPEFVSPEREEKIAFEVIYNHEDKKYIELKKAVKRFFKCFNQTAYRLYKTFPSLKREFTRDIYCISAKDLEIKYPLFTPQYRENEIVRKYKTVFIHGIGRKLSIKGVHEQRACDAEDWYLNGKLMIYDERLCRVVNLLKISFRVDAATLVNQATKSSQTAPSFYKYCSQVLKGNVPLTLGGEAEKRAIYRLLIGVDNIPEKLKFTKFENAY